MNIKEQLKYNEEVTVLVIHIDRNKVPCTKLTVDQLISSFSEILGGWHYSYYRDFMWNEDDLAGYGESSKSSESTPTLAVQNLYHYLPEKQWKTITNIELMTITKVSGMMGAIQLLQHIRDNENGNKT